MNHFSINFVILIVLLAIHVIDGQPSIIHQGSQAKAAPSRAPKLDKQEFLDEIFTKYCRQSNKWVEKALEQAKPSFKLVFDSYVDENTIKNLGKKKPSTKAAGSNAIQLHLFKGMNKIRQMFDKKLKEKDFQLACPQLRSYQFELFTSMRKMITEGLSKANFNTEIFMALNAIDERNVPCGIARKVFSFGSYCDGVTKTVLDSY